MGNVAYTGQMDLTTPDPFNPKRPVIRILVRADLSLIGATAATKDTDPPEGMIYIGGEGDEVSVELEVWREAP